MTQTFLQTEKEHAGREKLSLHTMNWALLCWPVLLQVLIVIAGSSDSKESAQNVGDLYSIPGLGRPPRGGYGNPLQYSCLENPMDKGAWWATAHGVSTVGHSWVTNTHTQCHGRLFSQVVVFRAGFPFPSFFAPLTKSAQNVTEINPQSFLLTLNLKYVYSVKNPF